MADVTMPQLGETVTEGTITKWMKKVGDKIEADEVLFEVSTDKVDSEVPSPAAGYVSEILVEEGETVDVGVKLAVISSDAPGDGDGSAPAEAEAESESEPDEEQEPEAEEGQEQEAEPEPEPAAEAAELEPEEPESEKEQEQEPEPAKAETSKPSAGTRPSDRRPAARPGGGGGKVLSPVVRRLIAEHDLDPESIEGTGAGGRVTRADVLKVIEGGARQPKAEPAAAEKPAAKEPKEKEQEKAPARPAPAPAAKAGERDEVVPFSNIRKRTAEHMVRSKATSAHTLVVIEVDYDGVERVRKSLKDRFRAEEGFGLSYLPFISRAVVDAVREFPHVNSSVGDNELIIHHDVNLGVAVDLNFEGLIVPVVHGADGKRLRAIARDIADLADRARKKKLGMDEISGGTFTLTNAGGYGTFITGPIINQPQVAILSTDGVKMRPVAVEVDEDEWAVAIHPTGNLALAWDHRAFDGAYAAAFLAKVKEILESRDWSQEF